MKTLIPDHFDSSLPKWSFLIPKFVSGITIILASSTLIGWIFYYWISKEYLSVILAFKPNTAICFILTGIVLWSSCEPQTRMQPLIKIGSAIVFLISVLTLFEYFFNINLGFDELIFKEPIQHVFAHIQLAPGRMTPLTAMNFVLLSFTLFFLDNKIINYRIYSSLLFIVLILSTFEFLFHIYSFSSGVAQKIFMGDILLQTTFLSSLLFIMLSLGIYFARINRGFISVLVSKNNSGRLARRLIPPAIFLPIIFGYIFISGRIEPNSIFLVVAIVLATSMIVSGLILVNAFYVNKDENNAKREALDLKQFQTLALKSANAGTWSWNIKKNFMASDKHLQKLFGIKLGYFPSHFEAIYNFIHPKDRVRVEKEIKNSLLYNSEFESEFRVFHPDGSTHNLATRGHIFRDHAGHPIKMAGICWDITERKKVEHELLVAKETAEMLAEEAGEANRAKSAFLAAMSHEIRTPLNGIMGTVELMYDTPLTQEQRDFIGTVRNSGDELLNVINDIIDYSRIESGRFELDFSDFNLQFLIDDTVERVVTKIQEKGLSIDAAIDPKIPEWFNGDPSRIRQILSNLLNNAAKFTEKGEISIRITLLENEKKEEFDKKKDKKSDLYTILFEVTDTGIGITPEVKERLFKPFSQGDFSNKRKHGGTGLGLIISKRLVELLNGSIGVESTPGVGSRFWFTIPLKACVSDIKEKKYEVAKEFQDTRILCVDDNPISREIMERQIKSWKLLCDVSPNAGHAISAMMKAAEAKKPYHLALIDYVMPGMDGLELIKIIRRLSEIDQTNIIILSPTGASFGLDEMKKLRIQMCLTKPLRQNALYNAITTTLQMIKLHQEPTAVLAEITNKNINILLAEDNETNKQVALRILKKLGFAADAVSNGFEVLKAISEKSYDLILMDCQMPEMDGYTATEKIRQLEQKGDSHIFIIAMTAHALKGDRQKCLHAGMDDYIAKPIDISLLSSTLQRWIGSLSMKSRHDEKTQNNKLNLVSVNKETIAEKMDNPIDMNRIKEIFGEDTNAIKQFLQTFVEATHVLLEKLQDAITQKDVNQAKDLFHQLKGSAANSGVATIQKLSLEGENKIANNDWQGAQQIYDVILEQFAKTKNEIDNFINQ